MLFKHAFFAAVFGKRYGRLLPEYGVMWQSLFIAQGTTDIWRGLRAIEFYFPQPLVVKYKRNRCRRNSGIEIREFLQLWANNSGDNPWMHVSGARAKALKYINSLRFQPKAVYRCFCHS